MASVYSKRGLWYIDCTKDGKRISTNTYLKANRANRKEADRKKKQIEDLIASNRYIVSTGQSLIAYVDMFKREHLSLKSKSHQGVFKDALAHFVKIVPPETKIENVTTEQIARYIEHLGEVVANATMLTYINYMKIFFNYLVEEEIIPRNPIRKKQIPKRIKMNIVCFSDKMIDDILRVALTKDQEYFKFLMLLLLTGARPIDVLSLTVGNFNLKEKVLTITISKTDKQILFPIYDVFGVFIDEQLNVIRDLQNDSRLFSKFNSENIRKKFQRIKLQLNITEKNIYTLKTFRKTFASYLASKGIDEARIADLLGHDDAKTTRKYYAAISTENLRCELNKVMNVNKTVKSTDKSTDKKVK